MAHGAQEVAVGRAGEEVEIISATLQGPGQNQCLAGPGSSCIPQGNPRMGRWAPQVEGWVRTHFEGAAVRVKAFQDYQSPAGEAGLGLELDVARTLAKVGFLVLLGSL